MLSVKEAVKIAYNYIKELYGSKIEHLLLEEVELSDDEKFWYVTLGFCWANLLNSLSSSGIVEAFASVEKKMENRVYKIFKREMEFINVPF